ncbi:MAG: helix-turn-helix transcriptional regulator [Anaerolineales bacterium]|nr:helix-turn-helix transcriptional regulator [Anaerolineales bacterium]
MEEKTTFDKELKRGTLEMILLQMISERQMYGYELVSTLESRGGSLFRLKEGTLYPVLYRLEKAGHIDARWETLERGVPRKYYRLTKSGAKFLEARVAEWKAFISAIERLMEREKNQ